MTDREQYNRDYLKMLYQRFRERKDRITQEQFEGRCFLCDTTEKMTHGHLHHIEYNPEDSSYTRNSKAQWTRELRLREAEEHPERFRLLCDSCHRLITSVGTYLLRRWQPLNNSLEFDKFLWLVILEMVNRQPDIDTDPDRYTI